MRLIALDRETGEETEYEIWGRVNTFDLDKQDRLHAQTTTQGMRLEYDGRNVLVTDGGLRHPLKLADLVVPPRQPQVWAAGQELQLGPLFLFLDRTPTLPPGIVTRTPLERISPGLLGLLILVALLLLTWWFWQAEQASTRSIRESMKTEAVFTSPISSTLPLTPTLKAKTPITPTVTPTMTLTLTPTRVLTPSVNSRDIFSTPTPTHTLSMSETLLAAAHAGTPMVLPTSALTPTLLPPRALGVVFEPAHVAIGGQFYRLLEAEWLDEAASHGYHHIFVDVIDEHKQRLYGVNVTVSWASGACTRQIDPKPPILINERTYIEYGADCPMFAAGGVYRVKVDGLPSDSLANVGLGSLEKPNWAILTSFRLKFQRTTNEK